MHRTEKGLILRTVPYRDADVMLTILTECGGKVSAAARGVRRKSSRMSAAVQSLTYSEFTLFESAGHASVNEAEPIEIFYPLRSDLVKLALASYLAELLEVVADAETPNPELLRLGLNGLYALSNLPIDVRIVKAAFELKVAAYAGYEPTLGVCPRCGKPADPPAFFLQSGRLHCATCPMPGGRSVALDAGAVSAMYHVLSCDVKRIFSFSLGEDSVRKLQCAAEEYLLTHFDRHFKTLDFYRSLEE